MFKRLCILTFLIPFVAFSQLVTSGAVGPAGLVQNVLLGPGVTVSNIMYNGSPGAIGSFTATGTNLGISSGIVMTTGTIVNNGSGPHGPNNSPNSGFDNGMAGSGLLSNQIGGTQTFNATTLEFNFVPYSDTVRFKYVFGSEEYPEFAPPNNSGFNDVFGFFISGPGISGMQNIARVPGSGSIVSINNVNAITNSAYFVNNGDGNSSPQNGSAFYIQYDGFTKVMEAVAKVQCGQTYHLVLSIADVGDGIYDSGIFLEANSLSSKTPVEITYDLSQQVSATDPSLMAEGCVNATVTLERGTNNINSSLTIPVTVSGTATEGVDFSNIPNSITFNAGQSVTSFNFDAFVDGLPEGVETIQLEFMLTDPCGNQTPIIINLKIQDVQPVDVTIDNPGILCPGDQVTLTANATGGAPPYTYLWSTGETTQSITVSPAGTTNYTVTVTDDCLGESDDTTTTVSVPVFNPLTITNSGDITEICPYINHVLSVQSQGGAGNYVYQWTVNGQQVAGNVTSLSVAPSQSTTYSIQVTDKCGNIATTQINYVVTSPPLVLTMSPDVEICPGDSVRLSVTATGGYGQYYYNWPTLGSNQPTVWVRPNSTTTYQVIVFDECQTFTVNGFVTVTVIQPTADFQIGSHVLFDDLPIQFVNTSQNANTYHWDFGDGQTSIVTNPVNIYDEPGDYLITLIATDVKGCKDTISKPIHIKEAFYVYVPNTFTPDGRYYNNTFQASFYGIKNASIEIYNRWGELVYESKDMNFAWDGTYQGEPVQDGTYTWKITYVTLFDLEQKITGHVNLLK